MKKLLTAVIIVVMAIMSLSLMAEAADTGDLKVELNSPFTAVYQFYTKDDYQDSTNGLWGIKYTFPINNFPIDIEAGVLTTFKDSGDNGLIFPVYASYKRYFNDDKKWFYNIAPGFHFYSKGDDKMKLGAKFGVGCKISEKSAINIGYVAFFEDGNPSAIELGFSF